MPIYEYRCADCATDFEALLPAGRADQATCAACDSADVRRLLSVFAAPRASGSTATVRTDGGGGGCCGGACGSC